MNELALFAGAGGGILGGHLLGWRTVCAVEWEQYPASVLCARQNEGLLPPFPIWDDVQTFDGHPWRGIAQVVSGGFPCQDISVAGKGDGLDGERSGMWREMARIIGEVQPQFAFVENSPMLTSRGLGTVLGDLAEMGFDAKWCVLGADSVGASHKRDRIWILATNARGIGCNIWRGNREERYVLHDINGDASESKSKRQRWISGFGEISANVANSNSRMHGRRRAIETSGNDSDRKFYNSESQQTTHDIWSETIGCSLICGEKNVGDTKSTRFSSCFKGQREGESWRASIGSSQWWKIEPPLDRVVDGMADRVDRLKAIGNGQVPLCAATAWRILSDGFC